MCRHMDYGSTDPISCRAFTDSPMRQQEKDRTQPPHGIRHSVDPTLDESRGPATGSPIARRRSGRRRQAGSEATTFIRAAGNHETSISVPGLSCVPRKSSPILADHAPQVIARSNDHRQETLSTRPGGESGSRRIRSRRDSSGDPISAAIRRCPAECAGWWQ